MNLNIFQTYPFFEKHSATIHIFLWTAVLTLLPLMAGVLYQLILKGHFSFDFFDIYIQSGDFYLFIASFLAPAVYIFNEQKDKTYGINGYMHLITFMLLLATSIGYAYIVTLSAGGETLNLNNFLYNTSYYGLLVAGLLFYWSQYLERSQKIDEGFHRPSIERINRSLENEQ